LTYDIEEFASEQLGRSKDQILVAVDWELAQVDYRLKGTRRGQAKAAGAEVYRRLLSGLGFLLRTGLLPRVAAEPAFSTLRPLCEDLAARGLLDGKTVAVFARGEVRKVKVASG
jgi:hypothetical protein